MIGWLKPASPMARFYRSRKDRERATHGKEALGRTHARVSLREGGEGFSQHSSPIWNDIQRALEGDGK